MSAKASFLDERVCQLENQLEEKEKVYSTGHHSRLLTSSRLHAKGVCMAGMLGSSGLTQVFVHAWFTFVVLAENFAQP